MRLDQTASARLDPRLLGSRSTLRSTGRRIAAAGVASLAAAAMVLGGVTTATAAQGGDWGVFTAERTPSGTGSVGTMTLGGGFPATTFTTDASQATVPSGASGWQGPNTPPGLQYGSSRGTPYLNLTALRNSPTPEAASTTTYSFDGGTPASGWSFVLGDIDADQATITATDAAGAPVSSAELGFAGVYNSCGLAGSPSCPGGGTGDVPSWDPATSTLTGNAAAADTQGATGWFSPTVSLSSLTIAFQQRSGRPIYQTWFATKTFAASGVALSTVDGAAAPYSGGAVTVTDATGRIVAQVTTDADGRYTVPALTATPGYTVTITPPDGADGATTRTFSLEAGDRADLDFDFTTTTTPPVDPDPVTVDVVGTITDEQGEPVTDTPIVIVETDTTDPVVETTTDDTGAFEAPGLTPETDYTIIVDGDTDRPIEFTTPAAGAPNPPLELEQPAAPVDPDPEPEPSPEPTPDPTPVPPAPTPEPAPDTVSISGTVIDLDGAPVVGAPVAVVLAESAVDPVDPADPTSPAPGDVVAATTTDDAGRFAAAGLVAETTYRVVVAGQTIATVTTGSTDLALGTVVLARDAAPDAPPFAGALPGVGPSLAYTGADAAAPLGFGAGLLVLGLVLATGAAVRGHRRHAAADRTE